MLTNTQKAVIGVFLTDVHHERDIQKKFRLVTEAFSKEELMAVVLDMERVNAIDREEVNYLLGRIERYYR